MAKKAAASKASSKKSKPAKVAPKKKVAKGPSSSKAVASKSKTVAKTAAKSSKAAMAAGSKAPKLSSEDKRRSAAKAAMEEAMNTKKSKASDSEEEDDDNEEFDPAAFFEASGGKGDFRAHVMRKERVDFNLNVRVRLAKDPVVQNAELINLSKGGLAIRHSKVVKAKAVLRVEIPLPHTSELFAVQAEVIWSGVVDGVEDKSRSVQTGLRFLPMSLAKQAVVNNFIQQRRDEIIMAKIGLEQFKDSVPVAGLD
jgi:hypothetical protein